MKHILLILLALTAFSLPAQATVGPTEKVSKILVTKSDRTMYLFNEKGDVFRAYKVSLGKNPRGHKQREGDGRTPEGRYKIDSRNKSSRFHLSLHISYPTMAEQSLAKRRGQKAGGDIYIHGLPNGKEHMTEKYNKNKDWTDGCIALDNKEIDELWNMVEDGTPIAILP